MYVYKKDVIFSFCDDFGLDSTEATMIYALQVLIRCSKQEDAKLHRELLEMSERAFDSLKLTENIFMRLYDCLMSLCPYDYEAIDLILKQMQKYAISDNEQHALILKRATITLQFLQRSEQSSVLTDGSAMIENASLEMIANEDRDMCSNGLFVTHLPNRSQNSLPFHPFLFEDNKDIKSETKMQLLSIGIDVGNMWLGPMGNQLLKPIQADERVKIATFVANLSKSHRRNRTELLLKKVDLLKNETIDLIKSPSDLVVFIYSNAINWNDPIDKKAKLELLNELVALNDLDHTAILDELIESWLGTDATAADAKDGMTDGLMNGNVAVHNPAKDLVYDFPYLDSSVSRIVHLLRSRPPTQAAVYLTSLINKDSNVVLHDTKIRSICCLMRLLSPEQFISILGYDATNVCVTLERLLYSRLINVCRIDLPIQTFIEQNKAHLTKSLLSSGVRQSMELLHFIACVVIDYEVVDRKLIFDLLTKLYGGRQREIVSRLLYLCRLYPALARQHNDLALIWRDIADWMYFSIDDSDPSMNEKLRRYVYFCLRSVKSERQFVCSHSPLSV
ncbi:unnamed protein product [Anisakis simplex]|uniref:Rod_C domain-containing protein n=1 Tax=Anisakis simplex TaxID=6269 RepID=A0A158PPJ6_ANISI|nr:unnamed protein product [Anisakis simplex]